MQNKNILQELLAARIPAEYAQAAVLQRQVLQEVCARLELITLAPRYILDVGCSTGDSTAMLKKQYPQAHILGVEAFPAMLNYAKKEVSPVEWICAAQTSLPFADHSIDMIMANFTLPWCDELQILIREWRRILRPDGLLMITTLGPDTLRELHHLPLAFPHLMDMHTVGDLLIAGGFKHPVLDVDYFTVTYREEEKCWQELQVTGMITGNVSDIQLEKIDEVYPVSYEVIFAHAFGPDLMASHVADEKGEVRIPLSHVLRSSR